MGPADVAAAARLILRAGGSNAPRRSERLAYAARQAWQRSRGRYVEALTTYRRVGEQLACVETGEGPLYVPASLGRDELAALLRYTYDPAAWHRYDGPWAPLPDGAVVVDCGASVGAVGVDRGGACAAPRARGAPELLLRRARAHLRGASARGHGGASLLRARRRRRRRVARRVRTHGEGRAGGAHRCRCAGSMRCSAAGASTT